MAIGETSPHTHTHTLTLTLTLTLTHSLSHTHTHTHTHTHSHTHTHTHLSDVVHVQNGGYQQGRDRVNNCAHGHRVGRLRQQRLGRW
jgi:hypothetical protein